MVVSYLSMTEARLPPGFRFHPRDEELVCDYLAKKASGDTTNAGGNGSSCSSADGPMLVDVDLNKCEPWDLPEMACVGGKEWYFFSLRDRKYATGQRTNRATRSGYWKATGKDRQVRRERVLVGMRKTLVFYQGRAPRGTKTDWVMHEFRMEQASSDYPPKSSFKEDWVLCRVFCKSKGVTSSKTTMEEESCGYDDTVSNSSLPQLLDTFIAFDQGYEKLLPSCSFSHAPPLERIGSLPVNSAIVAGALADFGPSDQDLVIKSLLNHFTKVEGTAKMEMDHDGIAEGTLESYLVQINEGAHLWNPL